jgi:hypothetical protein
MSTSNNVNPFWKVKRPGQQFEREQVQQLLAAFQQYSDLQWTPDLWMSSDVIRFSRDFQDQVFDTPMFPCRTVMLCPSRISLNSLNHEQLYIGNGFCARTDYVPFVENCVILTDLTKSSRRKTRFYVRHVYEAQPTDVLPRVASALGAFRYSVFGANCQSVTHWMLHGTKRVKNEVSFVSTQLLVTWIGIAVLLFLICILAACRKK